MKLLAIPLSNQKTIATWLVITQQTMLAKLLVIAAGQRQDRPQGRVSGGVLFTGAAPGGFDFDLLDDMSFPSGDKTR